MAETRDEFAEVEFALGAGGAAVEGLGDETGRALGSDAVVVAFVFLEFEVQEEAEAVGVVEHDAPLVELGAVVVEFLVAGDERPDVVAVAGGVVGEERDGVRAFGGEVIEGADKAFALLLGAPRGIAGAPVAEVRRPGF